MLATNHRSLHQCLADIRAKAKELRDSFGAEGRARALEWAATKVEIALISEADRVVYLPEAAQRAECERLKRLGALVDPAKLLDEVLADAEALFRSQEHDALTLSDSRRAGPACVPRRAVGRFAAFRFPAPLQDVDRAGNRVVAE